MICDEFADKRPGTHFSLLTIHYSLTRYPRFSLFTIHFSLT